MNIISIDPSKARTGIFTKVNGKEITTVIENPKGCNDEEAMANCYQIIQAMLDVGNGVQYDFGLIEAPEFGYKNSQSQGVLWMMSAVIKLAFYQARIPLVQVSIQTWKSFNRIDVDKKIKATPKSKTKSKDNSAAYLAAVKRIHGKEFETTDEADAYMIYYAAQAIAKSPVRLSPAAMEIRGQLKAIIEKKSK